MAKKIKQQAVTFPVPQTHDQVVEAIAEIGRRQRERDRIQADMNDELARIKERHEEEARPHADAIRVLSEGVHLYCEARRDELTQEGKTKTANLSSGKVAWRMRPPKVVLKSMEKVIEALKHVGLSRFIRTKEEVNKEDILSARALAAVKGNDERNEEVILAAKAMAILKGIKGIRIEQGEDFIIKPFETELEEIA
jgi:phage host-nuclease inhibitor protein Gam